jgi:hypothetical protein
MTQIQRLVNFDNAICGDSTGGLHLFRFNAL